MAQADLRPIIAALAALLAASSGCYYAHLAAGQARIVCGRVPIERALETDRDLRPDERAALALVPEIRRFAIERLGLRDTGSYRTFYDTGGGPVSWNVSAAPRTLLEPHLWRFPFVGEAPYKGFFDLEKAREEAHRLARDGLDVYVRPVAAYSTLGWFDDPVFRPMLGGGAGDLARTIIHEMVHATVFRPGDAEFNESLATFLGEEGALRFLDEKFGPDSVEARAARDEAHDARLFEEFLGALARRLDLLYKSAAPETAKLVRREEIFAAARREFQALRRVRFRSRAYEGFGRAPLNNAVVLAHRAYYAETGAFADVLDLCGGDFRRALDVFRRAAKTPAPRAAIALWRVAARDSRKKIEQRCRTRVLSSLRLRKRGGTCTRKSFRPRSAASMRSLSRSRST